jgi:hypothetical protein
MPLCGIFLATDLRRLPRWHDRRNPPAAQGWLTAGSATG